jgi:hypothetical protein
MSKKVLILLLAATIVFTMLTSCATTVEEINVTLIITAGEEEILNQVIPMNYKDPTVLMLVKEAAVLYEIPVVYNENDDSVLHIGEYEAKDVENITYFWEYMINDVLPENTTGGKANAQAIKDGDVIHYIYSSLDITTIKK